MESIDPAALLSEPSQQFAESSEPPDFSDPCNCSTISDDYLQSALDSLNLESVK